MTDSLLREKDERLRDFRHPNLLQGEIITSEN